MQIVPAALPSLLGRSGGIQYTRGMEACEWKNSGREMEVHGVTDRFGEVTCTWDERRGVSHN